ncbi:hypothetical protein IFM47457_10308 [Aspergillus lentulus]|nr:hypothetical protein IFM47457_10308 [Aspergillus lentulus]
MAVEAVRSFTCTDQLGPGAPRFGNDADTISQYANAFALDLRPQDRFEAPIHTGNCPERAIRESSTIS